MTHDERAARIDSLVKELVTLSAEHGTPIYVVSTPDGDAEMGRLRDFRRAFLGCPCGVSSREWLTGDPCPRCGHRHTKDERAAIDIIRRAVAAERERCAKIARANPVSWHDDDLSERIAEEILSGK